MARRPCRAVVPAIAVALSIAATACGSTASPSTLPSSTVPSSTVPSSTVPSTTVPSTAVPPSTVAPPTVPPSTVPPSTAPPSTVPASSVAPSTVPPLALPSVTTALFAGDSVALGEAPAVTAALTAAGVFASSIAFIGAGILAEPELGLAKYVDSLERFDPDLVIYQLSVWDRGTLDEQEAVYRSFADLVVARGAQLVFVTPPPFEAADEYAHMTSLAVVAADLARERPDAIHLLDAAPVWGTTFSRDLGNDGVADRMPDGIHVCQGGAFRFADWLIGELDLRFDGIDVRPIEEWVFDEWNASSAYSTPPAACDPLKVP